MALVAYFLMPGAPPPGASAVEDLANTYFGNTVSVTTFDLGGDVIVKGKVGIGTLSAGTPALNVVGQILSTSIRSDYYSPNVVALRLISDAGGGYIGFLAGQPALERARIDGSGNFMIGTTAPMARLHVSSAAASDGPMLIVSTGTSKLFEVNGSSIVANVPLYFPDGSAQTNPSLRDVQAKLEALAS